MDQPPLPQSSADAVTVRAMSRRSRATVIAIAIAAAIGGFAGLMLWFAGQRIFPYGDKPGTVGLLTLCAGPVFLGVVAGVAWPDRPARFSLVLSVVCLLVAAPLMGEGIVCLILLGPWFIVMAPIIAALVAYLRRRSRLRGSMTELSAEGFTIALAMMAFDQASASPNAPRVLSDSVVVNVSRAEVWSSIDELDMLFDTPGPWLVEHALPRPAAIQGGGAHVGAVRRVIFENGTVKATVTNAVPLERFDIDLRVEQSCREFFDHWVELDRSSFVLEELGPEQTRITHTTHYRPHLTLRWYGDPVERYLGHLVQRWMLDAYAQHLETKVALR